MNRKQFLHRSGALAIGLGLVQAGCRSFFKPAPLTNWAGNIRYSSAEVLYPNNIEELRQAIAKVTSGKTLGSMHSFSTVADTTGTHISTAAMNRMLSIEIGRAHV